MNILLFTTLCANVSNIIMGILYKAKKFFIARPGINIIEEWEWLMPSNLFDIRDSLPKHKAKKWGKRRPAQIQGLCVHQTAGNDKPHNTAAYHVKYFNRGKGAPGLCYTFYIDRAGKISWCNDIESVVWSQGWSGRPGSENVDFLSIVCGGNFSAKGYSGKNEPTLEQMLSLLSLIKWLCYHLDLEYSDILGHSDLGKIFCPGITIDTIIEALNKDANSRAWSEVEWQRALVELGYDLGSFGKNGDGCDGRWGNSSKAALVKFQHDQGIPESGFRDKITKRRIERELVKENS